MGYFCVVCAVSVERTTGGGTIRTRFACSSTGNEPEASAVRAGRSAERGLVWRLKRGGISPTPCDRRMDELSFSSLSSGSSCSETSLIASSTEADRSSRLRAASECHCSDTWLSCSSNWFIIYLCLLYDILSQHMI